MGARALTLIVRPRLPTDDSFLLELGGQAFAKYSRDSRSSMSGMLGERGAETVVAELAGAPVGFALLGYQTLPRDYGPWKRPVAARLNAIAVLPEREGRGIGRRLLSAAEEVARASGAVSVWLLTAETNRRARTLFSSGGFQPVLRLPRAYVRGQAGVTMFKLLDA
jgi:ribosomal protein S18 acetylase RimI-like enzyme